MNFDPTELVELLGEVENILANTEYNDVVWAGDLKKRNSQFSNIVENFVAKLELEPLWKHHIVDFTHLHTDNRSTSTLDHFLLSPRLLQLVSVAGVIHRGDNQSRHSPIWLSSDLGKIPIRNLVSRKTSIKPSWLKATADDTVNYTTTLESKLLSLATPQSLLCSDPHCADQTHSQERDHFMLDILSCILETSHTALPP